MSEGDDKRTLSVMQASTMLVGMVLGVFIFQAPSLVAANTSSPYEFLGLWLAGGIITLVGALCYAELATAYPDTGGEYHYLTRAYGEGVGFLFAWGRMTVIQTGAIAAVAFAFGNYANAVLPLGQIGPGVYAAASVAALTAVQLLGTRKSADTQTVLTALEVLGLLFISTIGFLVAGWKPAETSGIAGGGNIGLAMVFILLAYGGWNELSYIAGEMRDVRRRLAPVLIIGVIVVTSLYLVVNWAYLSAFGLAGLRATKAPAADVVGQAFGTLGATITALIVCAMALSTINASIFTGGRTSFALGRQFALFGGLGRRNEATGTPVNAILIQAGITLALIGLGSTTKNGFEYMVAYTAPVFWLFMIMIGVALFVLRAREPDHERPFRVPLFPVIPILWCAAAVYMFYSSLRYILDVLWSQTTWSETGFGALLGLIILAVGIPVYLLARRTAAEGPAEA